MVNIYNINRNLVLLENKVNKAFVDRINKKPSLVNTIKLAALRQTWYIDSCRLIFQIHSQIVIIEIILKMIGRLSFGTRTTFPTRWTAWPAVWSVALDSWELVPSYWHSRKKTSETSGEFHYERLGCR